MAIRSFGGGEDTEVVAGAATRLKGTIEAIE
jgi:hypothetical protein